ncbi:type II toxin-antitoxin system HicB family antitoxin [Dyella sp. LX-66]|uniref:type II toxin-antitoxin system HicB family antitoxin n=1 Tax=unclassified Dyella TaxID=2634549 RepID=UPI001BDF9CD9|nr:MULTISPECIES: type II toxin-antitoxin system HicB family antitoxin [unclassified Dyella]MBT2116439.1 type II toxin-antitoxin system HicB family antitoxin [Dyella sp. LX-1]MBT2140618.1 type II toxin-antitoxin system HicB family antitoxin [Dyella sp. LX-66]
MQYPIKLKLADGAYVASCRDLPAFNSVGDTQAEALRESVDALALALQGYIDDRRPIPQPSEKKRGEHWVALPALDVAKIGLYEAMRAKGMRKSDLTRLLHVHAPQVDRLLSLAHQSKLEQVEDALACLGYRVDVLVTPMDSRRMA